MICISSPCSCTTSWERNKLTSENLEFVKATESKLRRKKLEIVEKDKELFLSTMNYFQIIDDHLATISYSGSKSYETNFW